MCRNIRSLHNFEPPASEQEIRDAALQYVRKISGSIEALTGERRGVRACRRRGAGRDDAASRGARQRCPAEGSRGRGRQAPRPFRRALRRLSDLKPRQLLHLREHGCEQVARARDALERRCGEERRPAGSAPPLTACYLLPVTAWRPRGPRWRAASRRRPSSCCSSFWLQSISTLPLAARALDMLETIRSPRPVRRAFRDGLREQLGVVEAAHRDVQRQVDLQALRARGLGEALQAEVLEHPGEQSSRHGSTR